jgi:hypothetical protein
MGLFSRIFSRTRTYRLETCGVGIIKLPKPVRTTLGSRVRCIYCTVDLDYQIEGNSFKIVRVKLGTSYICSTPLNVMASHTGESWYADSDLRRCLNTRVLARVIDQLVQQDSKLQESMRENAGIFADATEKQNAFAARLGIQVEGDIKKGEMNGLIKEKLYGATDKQKAFAKRLGIQFEDGVSKREISQLIDQKLAEKRKH